MSYIQDNLMPNEKVLFSARVHPAVFIPSGISFVLSMAIVVYALRTASQITATSGTVAGFSAFAFSCFFPERNFTWTSSINCDAYN